ncbi:MAG: dihydrolipoamide acetyltransferase family protein [Actinomycetota bacterium]
MANVVMPQLGETVIEGTIIRWLKAEGDEIALDEPLFEISTDKVDTEVPSPAAGTLERILVAEGQTVPVGTDLALIGAAGSTGDADRELRDEVPRMAAPAEPATPVPDVTGGPAAPPAEPAGPPATPAIPPTPPAPPVVRIDEGGNEPADRGARSAVLSPVVRRLAAENDIDLSRITGTGTGGRITRADVEAAVASPPTQAPVPGAPQAPTPAERLAAEPPSAEPPAVAPAVAAAGPVSSPSEGEEVQPLSHLRRAIASHMVASSQTAARAWTVVEVDMENIVRLRVRVKDGFLEREGFKLTYMPFVTRAANEALAEFPMVNAELRGEELVMRRQVHMGIAVSIEGGLIVPVIEDAGSLNLVGLARAIDDVATRARSKQLKPDEVHGSTFSITNPGAFGSLASVPIINQPNTAILSFDAIEPRAVVIDDAIAIRHRVYLSMSWDHRVIDGALATQFLVRIKEHLEKWDWDEDLQR